MQRFLSTGLVLGLLVATAAAFAITEGLKLTQSPITRTRVDKVVSPQRTAHIRFWLRKPDTLTLTVVDSGRHVVRDLVTDAPAQRRWNTFVWNGRTDDGTVAKDGAYYARVHLLKAHRTIQLPNKIELDTGVPRVTDAKPNRSVFSPDGDGQSDSIKIHYRLSEGAHALLYVRGRQVVRTRFAPSRGSLTWYGRVDGVSLPQGTYRLRIGAEDPAGNVTRAANRRLLVVRIRYIALARRTIDGIAAGTRFGIRVDTDAKRYTWRLGERGGTSRARFLVVRAPTAPGRYRLVVAEHGHRAAASVVVVPR